MKSNRFFTLVLIAVMGTLCISLGGTAAAETGQATELKPLANYALSDVQNPLSDESGNFALKKFGNVTVDSEQGAAVFDGNSCLYLEPFASRDFTDDMTELTVTLWAKESAVGAKHRFMLGTGVANSANGFGMGFYETNSAYIVPMGGVQGGGYAANFVTSAADSFGEKVPGYLTSAEWNMFHLTLSPSRAGFGVNGHDYTAAGLPDGGVLTENFGQTLSIGGIISNDGATGFYNGFKGMISDVRIYDCVLSSAQISALYDAGRGAGKAYVQEGAKLIESAEETSFDIEADELTDEGIYGALSAITPRVTLSDGTKTNAGVLWNVSRQSGEESTASGVIYLAGAANYKGIKVTAKVKKSSHNAIRLNTSFTDNMVLQRGKRVRIFGYGGEEGQPVTVEFKGQIKSGTVEGGSFEIWLDAMDADAAGKTLTVTGGSKTLTLNNVAVGEVWLCGGQSNMAVTVNYINNKNASVKEKFSLHNNYGNIRFYDRPYAEAAQPKIDATANAQWQSPSSVEDVMNFSATATAFASNLSAMLGPEIPVGVINCSVGGSCIEEWIDAKTMQSLPSYAADMNKVNSRFYNGMTHNLTGMTIGGFVWYQGEANSQPRMVPDYNKQFKALVSLYRELFKDPSLSVIEIQLPQYASNVDWTVMRQAQWDYMKTVNNLYTVCAIDLGDNTSPTSAADAKDAIHPTDKWEMGKRIAGAVVAEVLDLQYKNLSYKSDYGISPQIEKAYYGRDGKLYIETGVGEILSGNPGENHGLEYLCGGEWKKAGAITVSGHRVSADTGADKATAVRYLSANVFPDNLIFLRNPYGLPLAPARSVEITEPPAADITVTVNTGAGGAVSCQSEINIKSGQTVSFTVIPDEGFTLDYIKVAGKQSYVAGNQFTSRALTEDTVIEVAFKRLTVTVSISSPYGVVTPSASSVEYGGSLTFTVKPEKGYKLKRVLVNEKEIQASDGVFTVENATDELKIVCEYNKSETGCGAAAATAMPIAVLAALAAVKRRR